MDPSSDSYVTLRSFSNPPKRCENIASVMRRVQDCPWNPFKMNEIVTLEKCLQEVALNDPRFTVILRKLAYECVFVEPTRKRKYLTRSKQDQLADEDLKVQTEKLRGQIDELDKEISFYKIKYENLLKQEEELGIQMFQLNKSIASKDITCKLQYRDFGLLIERVFNSFVTSLAIIKTEIPGFISAINQCNLVQQIHSMPHLYRKFLFRLTDSYERHQQFPDQLQIESYHCKKVACKHLRNYLQALTTLYLVLALIDNAYINDIPEEVDHLKVFHTHLAYLGKQIRTAPKKISYIYHDDGETILGNNSTSCSFNLTSMTQFANQSTLNTSETLPDDPELIQLFGSITKLCKYGGELLRQ